jgi:hypothetical protein
MSAPTRTTESPASSRVVARHPERQSDTAGTHDPLAPDEQAATVQLARLDPPGLAPGQILKAQHTVGNRAVGRLLVARRLAMPPTRPGRAASPARDRLQRHPAGTELQEKDAQVAEIGAKEQATPDGAGGQAPAATRTKQEEKAEKKAASVAGKAYAKAQKLTPGAMGLTAAQDILQGSFGGIKKIVPGTIVILKDQKACSEKYDEICINENIPRPDGSKWKVGDTAKDDAAAGVLTEGFAWKGVVYVNGETTLVTATAHEILHNNTEPKFRAKVGETFNEGVTETLARKALKDAGVKVPSVTAYPTQVALTKLLIDLVGLDVVIKAYFQDVQELVNAFTGKAKGTWDQLVQAAEALDKDKVKKALKKK